MRKNLQKGFTLLELLVVIAIIGLLASVMMVQFPGAMKKARDARRLEDIRAILTALRLYYITKEQYPGSTSSYGECESTCGCWDTSEVDFDNDGKPFIDPLVEEGFLAKVPTDPVGGGTCGGFAYRYYRYGAGTAGCDSSRGSFFVLGINDMESSSRPYPGSPGWSCPNRDWQNEFDWVTGGFEK